MKKVISLIVLILLVSGCGGQAQSKGNNYMYMDYNDNFGKSSNCYQASGNLICEIKDGFVQVQQYYIEK